MGYETNFEITDGPRNKFLHYPKKDIRNHRISEPFIHSEASIKGLKHLIYPFFF